MIVIHKFIKNGKAPFNVRFKKLKIVIE